MEPDAQLLKVWIKLYLQKLSFFFYLSKIIQIYVTYLAFMVAIAERIGWQQFSQYFSP